MQHKKQAVYWLTIFAMLLAVVGVTPASALFSSGQTKQAALSAPGSDEEVLPPTGKRSLSANRQ